MKTVLTYGTFDLFHIGHVKLLQRLHNLGDRLIIGLSTDKFNLEKGKETIIPYEHRAEILKSCRYVSNVFPETRWDQKAEDIRRENVSIFAMGDDWAGKFDYLSELTEVIYLPRTQGISTTKLKYFLTQQHSENLEALINVLSHAESLARGLRQ